MTRHPGARRTHSTTSPEPDDVVIAKAFEATSWARQNSRALVIGVIVLGIAIFAVVQYIGYRADLRERAAIDLLQVRQTAVTGDFPTAVSQLESFIQRFGDTPAAAEARLLLGQIQLAQGNAAQAVEAVRPVAEGGRDLLAVSAGLLLAGAHEAAGQPQEAEQAYLRVADRAELEFQRREALEDAARIRVAAGNGAGAVELYDRLIGMTEEGSADRDVYQMRRAEILAATGEVTASR